MNVLVYSGPGVSATSLSHTLTSLRTALSSKYAVQPILALSLATEPWAATCALLVVPGGRDIPYVSALGPALPSITKYVREGGSYLGLCAGAYFACGRVEFEVGTALEVKGDRELAFFPGTCEGCTYPGFDYASEEGARGVTLALDRSSWAEESPNLEHRTIFGAYYNGGGHFLKADSPDMRARGVAVLARYTDKGGEGKAAAVFCRVGRGRVILWSTHIEYPLLSEPARSALSKSHSSLSSSQKAELEAARTALFLSTLRLLNLRVPPSTVPGMPTNPLPQFLVSSPTGGSATIASVAIRLLLAAAGSSTSNSIPAVPQLKDTSDTFHIHEPSAAAALLLEARTRYVDDSQVAQSDPIPADFPKIIIAYPDGALPPPEQTPLFDLDTFFTELTKVRTAKGLHRPTAHWDEAELRGPWGMGDLMFYGEAVTSTQTMLDRNPTLLSALPTPLLSLATYQLSGRGRGGNLWLSPTGCLQFSLHLRPPSNFPTGGLVFIQYLFGLAVVEACRNLLGEAEEETGQVRLKWPNDIMAVMERGEKKKLGGVLVSTNYLKGRFEVVIGCGLNVLNDEPTASLKQLFSARGLPDPKLENVVATILPFFEEMWGRFLRASGSWTPFQRLYLQRWLHSDQLVTLTTTTPPTSVRIVGITPEHGLLRTVPAVRDPWKQQLVGRQEEEYIDLGPDGNSFDMIKGLIKRKI